MIDGIIKGVKISGIAAAVSNKWTSLETFIDEENDEKTVRKFIKMTGVTGRYDAGIRQTTSDFCYVAAKELLQKKDVLRDDIGLLVFVSQTPDYGLPATAFVLQSRLGLSKNCIAFDVNLGCSGFTYGLNIVSSIMKTNSIKKALLLCGDTSAKHRKPDVIKNTHSATMLFGDSGTATLLERCEDQEIYTSSMSDGDGYNVIFEPYGRWRNPIAPKGIQLSTMDDLGVFQFSTDRVPDLINKTMIKLNTTPDDYDCLVLHQANLLILKQIAKKTGFSMDKTKISIDVFGNTSSSSIPITLVRHYGDEMNTSKIHALMCGYGVGLSWSVVDAYIDVEDVLPLIHTDEYYADGYYFEGGEKNE
ncbi:MAG: ketoacyl-ACP synthase III [Lachnospiraceae bacterium]|nr:ketoacyl-ACP synthase III [Lachnospiraceae bacterium]